MNFPPFNLTRLLKTVFAPKGNERVAILLDFENLNDFVDLAFLNKEGFPIQKRAYQHFYLGLKNATAVELNLKGGEMYAYQETGGSNLDLPDLALAPSGEKLSLEKDIYPNYDIILCISTYSATAPLTAFAKKYGFRGATLHGVNDVILSSGLAVDYQEVSREAEKLRLGMTKADAVELDFVVEDKKYILRLELGKQEAQKSHGLCLGGPDIANLPAGEIYYVPTSAKGQFPLKFEDGSIALMDVSDGRIDRANFLSGNKKTVDEYAAKLKSDPAVGLIGELGFGTQVLPVSGADIQDEKVLGTFHVATGRSDHLGGDITPDKFEESHNASHDDILFAPHKTPEISAPEVRMYKDDKTFILIKDYQPAEYMQQLLSS
jgi:aminopeptidase